MADSFSRFNEQQNARLESLLKQHQAAEFELPALESDFSNWMQMIEDLKRAISSYFDSFNTPLAKSTQGIIEGVLIGMVYLLVAVAIIAVLVWLFVKLKALVQEDTSEPSSSLDVTGLRTELQGALEKAIAHGRWAEALRIRWLLFLSDCRLAAHLTPKEYLLTQQAEGADIQSIYRTMFGPGPADESSYRTFEKLFHDWATHTSVDEEQQR